MSRYADHLAHHTIVNPFPGLVKLETALGRPITARIGSNESMPQPESPLLARLGEELTELARLYPDPYAHALRERAAALNGVEAANVLFDTGADSLILLALRLACNTGDTVITTAGTYPTFKYFAEGVGARVQEIAYRKEGAALQVDLAALVEAARRENAALVYLANPDNPSGHYWPADAVLALREQLPERTTLLLDEAYVDFCAEPADAPLIGPLPNTFRLRTLSKAYALAGLRVGYAIAPAEMIGKADQIRPQFALSSIAQFAAQAVLDTPGYAHRLIENTIALRRQLSAALTKAGLAVMPSHTNFVAVPFEHADHTETVHRRLLANGVAIHRPSHPAVRHLLRITAHPQALDPAIIEELAQGQRTPV